MAALQQLLVVLLQPGEAVHLLRRHPAHRHRDLRPQVQLLSMLFVRMSAKCFLIVLRFVGVREVGGKLVGFWLVAKTLDTG